MVETGTNLYLTVNGTTICYDDWGSGDLPIVFIHGFPFDKSCWHPQMNVLKQDHRVIAYDIRGFGKSSVSLEIPSMDLYAVDLVRFLDQLGISKVIVCGLSMGGYIVLNAVQRFPEKFQSIILADTQCTADTPEAKEKRVNSIRQVMSGGLHEFADQFMSKVFAPGRQEADATLYTQTKQIVLSTAPETLTGALNALKNRKDMCSSLNQIRIPTLIICGEQDQLTPLTKSEALHHGIPGSKLISIDDSGHLSNLEQPQLFTQGLIQFVQANAWISPITGILT